MRRLLTPRDILASKGLKPPRADRPKRVPGMVIIERDRALQVDVNGQLIPYVR